jgi:hypothetical protein
VSSSREDKQAATIRTPPQCKMYSLFSISAKQRETNAVAGEQTVSYKSAKACEQIKAPSCTVPIQTNPSEVCLQQPTKDTECTHSERDHLSVRMFNLQNAEWVLIKFNTGNLHKK